MLLELPVVSYYDEKAICINKEGEREDKILSHAITVPMFIDHTDIIAISAAPLTDESLEEVMKMRGTRVWFRGGGGVDVNMNATKIKNIWEKYKREEERFNFIKQLQ